jgi:predicted esterase
MREAREPAVDELRADLASRREIAYYPCPSAARVAVVSGPRHRARDGRPGRLLRHGRFAYDRGRRVLADTFPSPGRLTVVDVRTGGLVDSTAGLPAGAQPAVIGPVLWSERADYLLGLTPTEFGVAAWMMDIERGRADILADTPVSHSLLGFRGTHDCPVRWLADGGVLLLRACADWEAGEDQVFDTDDGPIWPGPVVTAVHQAARVDVVVVDPTTGSSRALARDQTVTHVAVAPDQRHVLLATAGTVEELRTLLRYDMVRYEVYDTAGPGGPTEVGVVRLGSVKWARAAPATLVFVDRGLPGTVFWSAEVGAEPGLIAELPEPIQEWSTLSADVVVVVTGTRPPRLVTVPAARPVDPGHPLPGAVTDLEVLEGADTPLISVRLRLPAGDARQRLFRPDAAGQPVPAAPVPPGERLLATTRHGDLIVEECAPHRALVLSTQDGRRPVHHAVVAPIRRPFRTWHGSLPTGSYQLYLPEPPEDLEPLPLVLCLAPVFAASDRVAPADPVPPRTLVPPTPPWTYLPSCAVVTFTCPLAWHASTTFPEIVRQLRTAVHDLVTALASIPAVDADRLVLYGHSFGAAVAAVLLAEEPTLFRCAILRSGAYNRTLTPGGFQLERRTLWQTRDVYDGFTLAYVADRIATPVLLVQGTADPNSATTVAQAQALYEALRVAGGRARLLLLADEGHILTTFDGILTAACEELRWIRRWTGGRGSADTTQPARAGEPEPDLTQETP